ncbi:hypothetical protein BGW39_000318 [Mortierella sp. 14UC]|nr:hypothetical protein BGW39_000318 [Mortierella sp. 14UC]
MSLPDFRSRILPVLGPLPEMLGMSVATFITCKLAGWPMEPLPIKCREGLYVRVHRELRVRESKLEKGVETIALDRRDVGYVIEEFFRSKSAVSGSMEKIGFCRWRQDKLLSLQNVVVLTKSELDKYTELTADADLVGIYGQDVVNSESMARSWSLMFLSLPGLQEYADFLSNSLPNGINPLATAKGTVCVATESGLPYILNTPTPAGFFSRPLFPEGSVKTLLELHIDDRFQVQSEQFDQGFCMLFKIREPWTIEELEVDQGRSGCNEGGPSSGDPSDEGGDASNHEGNGDADCNGNDNADTDSDSDNSDSDSDDDEDDEDGGERDKKNERGGDPADGKETTDTSDSDSSSEGDDDEEDEDREDKDNEDEDNEDEDNEDEDKREGLAGRKETSDGSDRSTASDDDEQEGGAAGDEGDITPDHRSDHDPRPGTPPKDSFPEGHKSDTKEEDKDGGGGIGVGAGSPRNTQYRSEMRKQLEKLEEERRGRRSGGKGGDEGGSGQPQRQTRDDDEAQIDDKRRRSPNAVNGSSNDDDDSHRRSAIHDIN